MNKKDEQKFGLYVFVGFAFGAMLGLVLGIASGNVFNGVWIGGLAGVAIGWFAAAVVMERQKEKKEEK